VFEGLQKPHPTENVVLNVPTPSSPSAWVREVQLLGAGLPRLWARTVIPHWSADNPWSQVQTLGQQPLGELLFVWPDIVRGPLHVAHTPMGWARYCVYHRHQAPLLLAEVFLPALLQP
jgi:chorismate--pyruvate lyase